MTSPVLMHGSPFTHTCLPDGLHPTAADRGQITAPETDVKEQIYGFLLNL
jgi:hypothetical protein